MENRYVRFEDSKNALLWLMSHRNEHDSKAKLYDEYGNYVVHSPFRNIIEHHYFLGDSVDDDGNLIPGDWDYDQLNYEDFIDRFENIVLESI